MPKTRNTPPDQESDRAEVPRRSGPVRIAIGISAKPLTESDRAPDVAHLPSEREHGHPRRRQPGIAETGQLAAICRTREISTMRSKGAAEPGPGRSVPGGRGFVASGNGAQRDQQAVERQRERAGYWLHSRAKEQSCGGARSGNEPESRWPASHRSAEFSCPARCCVAGRRWGSLQIFSPQTAELLSDLRSRTRAVALEGKIGDQRAAKHLVAGGLVLDAGAIEEIGQVSQQSLRPGKASDHAWTIWAHAVHHVEPCLPGGSRTAAGRRSPEDRTPGRNLGSARTRRARTADRYGRPLPCRSFSDGKPRSRFPQSVGPGVSPACRRSNRRRRSQSPWPPEQPGWSAGVLRRVPPPVVAMGTIAYR